MCRPPRGYVDMTIEKSRIPHGVLCSCDDCMDEDSLKRALGDYTILNQLGIDIDSEMVKK